MQKPSLPANEIERLNALKKYAILDTLPEDIFDDFTALASEMCGTPIALISLIDENRQWFKSKVGFEATQCPRDLSFCGHAILNIALFEVENVLTDPRFSDNPLVINAPYIRFYAGMPLTTEEGYNLGTLCVMDTVQRTLTLAQRDALNRLARQILSKIEHKMTIKTISHLNHTLSEQSRFINNITNAIPALISYWDTDLRCQFANQRYFKFYGMPPELMLGKTLEEVAGEKLYDRLKDYAFKALAGESQIFEMSRQMEDGTLGHGVITYTSDFDEDGLVKGYYAMASDITALKLAAQDQLLANTIIQNTNHAVLITDKNHLILSVNTECCRLTGYLAEELVGKNPQFLYADNMVKEHVYDVLTTSLFWQGEMTYRKKDGALFTSDCKITCLTDTLGEVTHHVATFQDNTEYQKTKNDLAFSRAMLERAGKMANLGGWEYDWHSDTIFWSDQLFVIHEIEHREAPPLAVALLFYPEEARKTLNDAIVACIQVGTPWDLELPFVTAKGKQRWIRVMGELIKINGAHIKLVGTFQDITERKHQELQTFAKEIELRNALIREVHHHIKNNIQGVSGLLYSVINNNPALSEPINQAIAKLQTVAVIHGLQGKNVDTAIEMSELITSIIINIESIWQTSIQFSKSNDWRPCYLLKSEAVPVALILNELITNAKKHGLVDSVLGNLIVITLSQTNHDNASEDHHFPEISITISNKGDFEPKTTIKASNINQTGLNLVSSLMPRQGAYLQFLSKNGIAIVSLLLKPPIITFNNEITL